MGWKKVKRFVLGCCGGGSHENRDDFSEDDLRHPTNQACLPQPKSGCRGFVYICDDGQMVQLRNPPITTAVTLHSEGALEDEDHSRGLLTNTEEIDAEMIENNREMFEEMFGTRMLADALADDKGSIESRSVCSSESEVDVVGVVEKDLAASSPLAFRDEGTVVPALVNEEEDGEKQGLSTRPLPKKVATRKRKVPDSGEALHVKAFQSGEDSVEEPGGIPSTSTEGLAIANHCLDSPVRTMPLLSDNPDAFWKLLRSLSDQLGPLLNPSGAKVTRSHDWRRDGCICRYLFPPDSEAIQGPTPYKIETIETKPQLPVIRQLPLPQTAILSPIKGYKSN